MLFLEPRRSPEVLSYSQVNNGFQTSRRVESPTSNEECVSLAACYSPDSSIAKTFRQTAELDENQPALSVSKKFENGVSQILDNTVQSPSNGSKHTVGMEEIQPRVTIISSSEDSISQFPDEIAESFSKSMASSQNAVNTSNQNPYIVLSSSSEEAELSTPEEHVHSIDTKPILTKPIFVSELPFDIDGNVIYKLPYCKQKKMKSSLDGRPWKTWVTSSRKGFAGTRRRANCKGSYKCHNKHCSYRKQYQTCNRTQFEKEEGKYVCKCCGVCAQHIDCPATKVWEFPRNNDFLTVIHTGYHTCVAVSKPDSSKLEDIFNENPDLRPAQAACKSAVNAIKAGKSWDEVKQITDTFINLKKVKNVKQKIRKQMNPYGVNFEVLVHLKSKVDSQDPFYIYRIHDEQLQSFVFKTSRTQIKVALSMDRHTDGILSKEYCYMDVKHNRCHGFKTFSIHVYHPLLRKVITLATMECEKETTKTFTTFWNLFNEALKKVSLDSKVVFNPFGWMGDEAGANWTALAVVFGEDAINRTLGCQFHFKQSVNRHANKLNSDKSKAKLKQLADSLMRSATPSLYTKCLQKITDFISEKPHKRSFLTHWLEWWDQRRFHVFNAFRSTDNAPTTNLAEPVHSAWKTTQATNITLVDAAYHDIAEAIHVERLLEQYKSGLYQGGTGPRAYSRQEQNHQSQMQRADQYASEILTDRPDNSSTLYHLDPHCSHRPTKPTKRKSKKSRISSHLQDTDTEQLSSSSSDQL